jgi:DNA invertase Pin-like site-specific DNA recombinase
MGDLEKSKKRYRTALYLRLSRDDEDVDGYHKMESNSIRSQRELLEGFVLRRQELEVTEVYTDDGFSGSSFQRPGFERMMDAVKAGLLDCIVVKDLSRLGRDYITAGRLIQKILPEYGIRFIAVTDHYDSLTADRHDTSLVIPVKNFVNDSYCRDISQKVRSHQQVKREKGEFVGAFAVYGYHKSPKDRNKLQPDPYAASIVKRIFYWKISGMGIHSIAEKLNEQGVLSPLAYKKLHGEKLRTSFEKMDRAQWSPVAVERILTNEIYTGTMVQGKTSRISYKVKKSAAKSPEDWVRVERTHEPIISRADFILAGKLLGVHSAHELSGLLYCGDCGSPMIRREAAHQRVFYCSLKNQGKGCSRHRMSEKALSEIVSICLEGLLKKYPTQGLRIPKKQSDMLRKEAVVISESEVIRKETALLCEGDVLREEAAVSWEGDVLREEIALLYEEREKLQMLCSGLYGDWKEGILTEDEYFSFKAIYEKQRKEIQEMIDKQEKHLEKREGLDKAKETEDRDGFLFNRKRLWYVSFIEKIEIGEKEDKVREICITFRFCFA